MSAGEREPGREELLAMAYADGELRGAEREAFEALLAARPDLRREVAQQRRLHLLAREQAPPEPMDFEWAALAREPLHRAGLSLGFGLLLAAALGLLGLAFWGIASADDMPLGVRLVLGALLGGGVLLFVVFLRARLRTLPYDPYTEVQR